jgi:5-(carboxyamino)imidazole ribonucleotide synthase
VTVGVLGGGQLARMLALAGHPLGVPVVAFSEEADSCAALVTERIRARFDDVAALDALAQRVEVVTCEFENVPPQAVAYLSERTRVLPRPAAWAASRDRLAEKQLFTSLGIPLPAFARVDSLADLERAVARIGLPAVLKTRTAGYDGKGQVVLRAGDEMLPAWTRIGGVPAVVEAFVPFVREVSIIAVRGLGGETAFYPLVNNSHHDGILRLSVPSQCDPLQDVAATYARRLLDELDYVGVLTLELFDCDGTLMANEFAPRVHNSGHWTIEGAETSQFENHLRAVTGRPLGSTAPHGHAAMVNIIGSVPDEPAILAVPGAHLHLYRKEPRPGRKLGHVTVCAGTRPEMYERLRRLLSAASGLGAPDSKDTTWTHSSSSPPATCSPPSSSSSRSAPPPPSSSRT